MSTPLLYVWLAISIACAALPFRFPNRKGLSAILLLLYIFSPYSLSIGIFYIPALVAMTLSFLADTSWTASQKA